MDIDIGPISDKTDTQPDETGETIPLTPGGVREIGSVEAATWERETLFGETSLRMEFLRNHIEFLYQKLYESMGQTPESFHFDYFEVKNGKGKNKGEGIPVVQRQGQGHSCND